MNDSSSVENLIPSLDNLTNLTTWSPTLSPSFLSNDGGATDSDADVGGPPPDPEGGGTVAFEYGLMLWYSAFMFVVSGSLFVAFAVERWRGKSPVWLVKGLDIASWSSLYFAFSVTLVVYNKWLIAVWEGGFSFPLTMTLVHMALKMIMSWTVVRGCRASSEVPKVSRWTYYVYACPVGATTGLDVASSNASLYYVSVTLYTVIKSTSLVFVLIYSVLYRLQLCSRDLVLVTGVIFAGVIMASYGDAQFDAIGFTLVLVASALGGYRWALTEVLMNRIGTKMNSLMTIYTISPASVAMLVPFAAWLEWGALTSSKFYMDPGLFFLAILNVCGSGVFAFAMIYVELAVLNRTSSLSLVIIGYFKQMAQIIVSVIVFHEILTPVNVAGVLITFLGMGLYAKVKHASSSHGARPSTGKRQKRRGGTVNAREVDESQIPLASMDNSRMLDSSFEDVVLEHSEAGTLPGFHQRHHEHEHQQHLGTTSSTPLTSAAIVHPPTLTGPASVSLAKPDTKDQNLAEHEMFEMALIEE